jgi:hypothetical protein
MNPLAGVQQEMFREYLQIDCRWAFSRLPGAKTESRKQGKAKDALTHSLWHGCIMQRGKC